MFLLSILSILPTVFYLVSLSVLLIPFRLATVTVRVDSPIRSEEKRSADDVIACAKFIAAPAFL